MKLKFSKEEIKFLNSIDIECSPGKDYTLLDIIDMEEKVSDYLEDYHFFPHNKNIQDVGVAAEMFSWLHPLIYGKRK